MGLIFTTPAQAFALGAGLLGEGEPLSMRLRRFLSLGEAGDRWCQVVWAIPGDEDFG